MKINLFKKSNSVSISTVHSKGIDVERDWLFILGLGAVIVLLAVITSATFFIRLSSENSYKPTDVNVVSSEDESIDTTSFQNAIDFIKSKKGD